MKQSWVVFKIMEQVYETIMFYRKCMQKSCDALKVKSRHKNQMTLQKSSGAMKAKRQYESQVASQKSNTASKSHVTQ